MFVQTETVLPCLSINFLYTGPNRNLSGTLQKLSGSHNSTEIHPSIWASNCPTSRPKTKLEYTKPIAPHWTTATQNSFDDTKQAILSIPCLKRFDHNRLIVLRSDFLSKRVWLCYLPARKQQCLDHSNECLLLWIGLQLYDKGFHSRSSSSRIWCKALLRKWS